MENYDEYFKRAKLLTSIYALKQEVNVLKGNNHVLCLFNIRMSMMK